MWVKFVGICMEALCSPHSTESLESIIICQQALYTLLDSVSARQLLTSDKSIAIELCNVLHRLLLTRDNNDAHLLCMEILKQVMVGAKEQYEDVRTNKLKESGISPQQNCRTCLSNLNFSANPDIVNSPNTTLDLDLLGEGGEIGEIVAGQSLVFAVLEVCLCLLIRHIPALSPTPNSTIIVSLKVTQPAEVSGQLIASALTTLENLSSLCSPQG